MSQFLGRRDCIESLRKDLVDLQGSILDVFSRTGPVRFSSWKFPDKLSCNLDMAALLEQYDFVEGEDTYNQHSHIVLLELLVDRLLLLLQSFNAYVEQPRREQTQKGCLSIGLVVINYWSNLLLFSNMQICNRSMSRTPRSDCEESSVSPRTSSGTERCTRGSSAFTPKPPCRPTCSPKGDSCHVSCQTVESSVVPCSACHQVQCILRKTGDALVELFQSEGLPSSLQTLLPAVEGTLLLGQMTASDIAQWASEQLRDMRRLAKHLQDMRATIQPLTERLAAAQAELEHFRSRMKSLKKELKQEVQKHEATVAHLELSLQKAQKSMEETQQQMSAEQQQLRGEMSCLEKSHSNLKEKAAAQEEALRAAECERDALQEKVRTWHLEKEACGKLQERICHLDSQLSETQLLLDKENAKYRSACRQQESMQAKQRCLLERVDALDEECEELQRQLGQWDERERDLKHQLQRVSEGKEELQAQLSAQQDLCSQLQKEKQTTEARVDELKSSVAELQEFVHSLRQRERLLVAFPELSPPAHTQPQSTGDVLLDMEQQVLANSIRIRVLEQENVTLHNSLVKLKERAQQNAAEEMSHEQTWSVSLSRTSTEEQQNDVTQTLRTPLYHRQRSSSAHVGHDNSDRGRRASGPESIGDDHPVCRPTSYLKSSKIHLQTLQFSVPSPIKPHRTLNLSQGRGLKQRKK